MCLNNEVLRMRYWKEEDCYVGTGYKLLTPEYVSTNGGKWMEATGNWGFDNKPKTEIKKIKDNEGREYHAGFHILLNEYAAKQYDETDFYNGLSNVYRVDFTDVIGFGKQNTDNDEEDCVITRRMYIHPEPISESDGEDDEELVEDEDYFDDFDDEEDY